MAYIIMFLMGVGMIFPWNAFITSFDYWFSILGPYDVSDVFPVSTPSTSSHRIHQTPSPPSAHLIPKMANMVPNLLFLVLQVLYGNRFSIRSRTYLGFTLHLFVLGSCVGVVSYVTDPTDPSYIANTQHTIFILMVVICVIAGTPPPPSLSPTSGCSTSILQGSLFGYAGQFPSKYTQALMGGNAVAGYPPPPLLLIITSVIVAGLKAITKESFASTSFASNRTSSLLYFAIAAAVIVVCLLSFVALLRLPFTLHHIAHSNDSVRRGGGCGVGCGWGCASLFDLDLILTTARSTPTRTRPSQAMKSSSVRGGGVCVKMSSHDPPLVQARADEAPPPRL
jgi:solute carrier family 29 (equilibrative nucleoside transporter), member 1/2/3